MVIGVLEAYYIAQAVTNYIYNYSPQRIILGGGVMHQKQLIPLIRDKARELNAGYVTGKELIDMDQYIVPLSLRDEQGIPKALELGRRAYEDAL